MHIGFILDWNRRWATTRWLIKMLGHTAGVDNIENILDLCLWEKIEFVSMWILAKKNIENRSKEELKHLYSLFRTKIPAFLPNFIKKWIRFETVWDLNLLPDDIKIMLNDVKEKTKHLNNMTFILGIWYGWQDEIVRWVKDYIKSNLEKIKNKPEKLLEKLNEQSFSEYLDSWKFPPPDLIVRTGWDIRLSWYFLYQSEYSEYYFTKTLWPDFNEDEFYKAYLSLKWAKRNFWK